ncbi:MAG: GNAT family N-acetyltransferase [Acidimicrobiia bacterium]
MIETVSSTDVSPEALVQIRSVVDAAFGAGFSDDDWRHALGGWHVVAFEEGVVIGHAAVVPRMIESADRPFHTGYVEAMAVHPDRQRHGIGSTVMVEAERIIRSNFELGALSSNADGFYERLGWDRWLGPTYARGTGRRARTRDDDGGIFVLRFGPSDAIDLSADISCEERSGDHW